MAALGTSALVQILDVTIADSTTKALILACGAGAQLEFATVTISGGTLKTSAGGEITDFAVTALSRVTIAAASLRVINDIVTLNSGTIGAGATIETNDGSAIVSGTVTNGGTLFANGSGGLVEIASGVVVNGGLALVGNGIVEIAAPGQAAKTSGSCPMAAADSNSMAWEALTRARWSGLAPRPIQSRPVHRLHRIGGGATASYTSAASHTSGTLMVTSGGVSATTRRRISAAAS
jgi:hypothetical protein